MAWAPGGLWAPGHLGRPCLCHAAGQLGCEGFAFMGEPSDVDSSKFPEGQRLDLRGGWRWGGGRGAWMLGGARSHGQEVLEPSVYLDATSTALPVDSRWSMLGQANLRSSNRRPSPARGGALGPPTLKSEFSGLGFADLASAVYGSAAVVSPARALHCCRRLARCRAAPAGRRGSRRSDCPGDRSGKVGRGI